MGQPAQIQRMAAGGRLAGSTAFIIGSHGRVRSGNRDEKLSSDQWCEMG